MDRERTLRVLWILGFVTLTQEAVHDACMRDDSIQPTTDISDILPTLTDNNSSTCVDFEGSGGFPWHTILRLPLVWTSVNETVQLTGTSLGCHQAGAASLYLLVLEGNATLRSSRPVRRCTQTGSQASVGLETCTYSCQCDGGCREIQLQHRPRTAGETGGTWSLCDVTSVPCPSPQMVYVKSVHQCYHLGTVNMGEDAALAYCTALYPDTRLASVLSTQEQHAIEGLLWGQTGNYMTSGRRPAGGGQYDFVWSDSGEDMVYRNFYPGQPYRGSANDDCVMLVSVWSWQWDDGDCPAGARPLCKYQVQP